MLTKSQLKLYDYVLEYVNSERVWPTYREMQDAFGWKSPNSVTRKLKALHRKGYLDKSDDRGFEFSGKVPGRSDIPASVTARYKKVEV